MLSFIAGALIGGAFALIGFALYIYHTFKGIFR